MRNKQFAILVIITFFVGMVWLITDIIFNTKASVQISDKLQTLLDPVNPNFNGRVLEIIDKETLDRSSISVSDAAPIPSPSPDATPLPTPETPLGPADEDSPSGELSP